MDNTNLLLVFFTGLTTGGLTCLAVQGGLLASVLTPVEKELKGELENKEKALPILSFLIAKLVSHTLLGFALGFAGNLISLTPTFRGWLQIFIGLYLVGVALSLLNVHPIFRYFIIQPPKFLAKLVKNQTKSQSIFTPGILGALTVFIPCATTQAMAVLALGTANPLLSAAIMFSFVLGTSPTFFVLGFLFSKLGDKFQNWFYKAAAALIIFMAILSINGGISLMGSIYTLGNFWQAAKLSFSNNPRPQVAGAQATEKNGTQEVNIDVSSYGYSPQNITLKKGLPVTLKLTTNNTNGCTRAFTIPSLKLSKILPTTGTETINFIPNKTGPLVFTCSMGMYTGVFNVI
ncbi:sulfite exporter TauE/SafE family protein [Candidatus Curtissbacteria bacterium]|nr:sulfite exporter TauE/SafE family protein [Candidatus Curtissbacteria bacterium]